MRTTTLTSLFLCTLLASAAARCPCNQHRAEALPNMMLRNSMLLDLESDIFSPMHTSNRVFGDLFWPFEQWTPRLSPLSALLAPTLVAAAPEAPKAGLATPAAPATPTTAQPRVASFDVSPFDDDELSVDVKGAHVVVEGRSQRGSLTHSFTKTWRLEDGVDASRIKAVRIGDRLEVHVPPPEQEQATAVPIAKPPAAQPPAEAHDGNVATHEATATGADLRVAAEAEGQAFWDVVKDAASRAKEPEVPTDAAVERAAPEPQAARAEPDDASVNDASSTAAPATDTPEPRTLPTHVADEAAQNASEAQ